MLCVLLASAWAAFAPEARAHADLVRAEPPVDGLVLTAPDELRLFFSEDVADGDPKPSVRILNEQGTAIAATMRPVGSGGSSTRELIVDVGSMGEGIFTVEWTVQSATDGHILSGTYAFRVGGGLPPGQATTEGERPEPWAVTARWATFLGASVAAAGFLFGFLLPAGEQDRAPRRRLLAIIAGAALALIASLLEPVLLAFFPPEGVSLNVGQAVRSLPDAWWWRPGMLIPVLILAIVVRYAIRCRLARPLAIVGGAASLLSLLGLSLTSHAAGLENGRELAVTSDIVHQVATALWAGGLIQLAVWWSMRADDDAPLAAVVRRFSTVALGLFVISAATGVLNASALFPRLSDLWESGYGLTLLVKLTLLVVPFTLAAWHRVALRRAGKAAMARLGSMRRSLRLEALLVVIVLVPAAALALSAPPIDSPADLAEEMTIAMPATTGGEAGADPEAVVHLTFAPGRQGENRMTLRLTDPDGAPLPADPEPRVTAELTSLEHDVVRPASSLTATDVAAQIYELEGLTLTIDGWWRVRATIRRAFHDDIAADFYLLVPDPNMNGFDAPPQPASDPEAEALLQDALDTMSAWTSVRWRQDLSGGNDSLIVSDYAVTTEAANGQLDSFLTHTVFAGSFAPRSDGSSPEPPRRNSSITITIGDQGWDVDEHGSASEQAPSQYLPIDRYPETYEGAQYVRFGSVEEIDGRETRIVTFHTPEQPTQSQAWFAFWIDTESGDVIQLAMVARNHYMVWHYSDINADFVIEAPGVASPDASPDAIPVESPGASLAATPHP